MYTNNSPLIVALITLLEIVYYMYICMFIFK